MLLINFYLTISYFVVVIALDFFTKWANYPRVKQAGTFPKDLEENLHRIIGSTHQILDNEGGIYFCYGTDYELSYCVETLNLTAQLLTLLDFTHSNI